ncbi:MAG: DNA polymerase-3 subunit gamma/tau [Myxococcota bacterium]|jgi:DNA polymerase-3 subunit gamma/tau
MSYLVLARKCRPTNFEEIIGQEHVTRALSNAIRLDRVAHAFLFTGARGVGKTTAARCLAKSLQCEKGPTPDPCLECSACVEIAAGSNVDVFEIDGASNRGINEIRELRDGVAYAPQRDRFKIYIIDEVHMLTQEAFNALLKTLEEPPRHVKFFFATTEPQKIPVTILSRCQRYDFKRVPLGRVKEHLMSILEREGISVVEEGLRMIARESEGSVRDALSLLDRVISFAGESADAKTVAECLGIADRKWLLELNRAMLAGDTATALGIIADVHHFGYDMRAFVSDLLGTLRDLIVVKICGADARASELSDAEAKALLAIGEAPSMISLQRIFQILLKAADEVAASRHPRLVVEMAIIRASTLLSMESVPAVLARIEALEQRLSENNPPPSSGGGGGGGGAGGGGGGGHRPAPSGPPAGHGPQHGGQGYSAAPQGGGRPAMAHRPAQIQAVAHAQPAGHERARPRPEESMRPEPPMPAYEPPPQSRGRYDDGPSNRHLSLAPGRAIDAAEWPKLVESMKETDPLLASFLENLCVLDARPGTLVLGVASEFYLSQLSTPEYKQRLELLAGQFASGKVSISLEQAEVGETIASDRAARRAGETEVRRARLVAHPLTKAAVAAFRGKVVDVRVDEVITE